LDWVSFGQISISIKTIFQKNTLPCNMPKTCITWTQNRPRGRLGKKNISCSPLVFDWANIMFLGELNNLKDVRAALKTSFPSRSDYKT
jgi:hypothetical protein